MNQIVSPVGKRFTICFVMALVFVCGWKQIANGKQRIRIATFNVSLNGKQRGEICERLGVQGDEQAGKIAEIVQIVRPDVLLVNELDHDPAGKAAELLAKNYFGVERSGNRPVQFPHIYVPSTNTGVASGLDLNQNGVTGEPNDAWGFGNYPGQYGFAVFSRFPLVRKKARTFQHYRWSQYSGAARPRNPLTDRWFHDDMTWSSLKLSSKNHVDLPIRIGERTVHLLASHPTPPVFDGPEDQNGCRNHDEIQFWSDYLSTSKEESFKDDQGRAGGLGIDQWFVIAGDLNSDPNAGDSRRGAIQRLLSHPRLQDPQPLRRNRHDQPSLSQPEVSTADFGKIGQLRVDYVLPCRQFSVVASGVFWPKPNEKDHHLILASDHRMVWVEVEIP